MQITPTTSFSSEIQHGRGNAYGRGQKILIRSDTKMINLESVTGASHTPAGGSPRYNYDFIISDREFNDDYRALSVTLRIKRSPALSSDGTDAAATPASIRSQPSLGNLTITIDYEDIGLTPHTYSIYYAAEEPNLVQSLLKFVLAPFRFLFGRGRS